MKAAPPSPFLAAAAAALAEARRARAPVGALDAVQSFPEAYAVQEAFLATWPDAPIGHKVGCSSEASQRLVHAPGPIAGRLFRSTHWTSPATLPSDAFFVLGVEAEIGFRLGADLAPGGARHDRVSVAAAVSAVVPLIEICDTRLAEWKGRSIQEITADNAFHGGVVTGTECADWRGLDLAAHRVTLSVDGIEKGAGTGADVLGHPLDALAWLANALSARGIAMKAGELIAAGTCTGLHIVAPGSRVTADFGSLGSVEIRFAPSH